MDSSLEEKLSITYDKAYNNGFWLGFVAGVSFTTFACALRCIVKHGL